MHHNTSTSPLSSRASHHTITVEVPGATQLEHLAVQEQQSLEIQMETLVFKQMETLVSKVHA